MSAFPGLLAAAVVLLSLLTGAAAHAARPAALGSALRTQRVLPRHVVGPVALGVPIAEGALGCAGLAALLAGQRLATVVVLVLAAALFATYAGYTHHLVATGRNVPCGCAGSDLPVSSWVTRRALALSLLALAALALAFPEPAEPAGPELATLLLAAPACTALLWVLPAAMHRPFEGAAAPWTSPPAP